MSSPSFSSISSLLFLCLPWPPPRPRGCRDTSSPTHYFHPIPFLCDSFLQIHPFGTSSPSPPPRRPRHRAPWMIPHGPRCGAVGCLVWMMRPASPHPRQLQFVGIGPCSAASIRFTYPISRRPRPRRHVRSELVRRGRRRSRAPSSSCGCCPPPQRGCTSSSLTEASCPLRARALGTGGGLPPATQ